MATTKVHGTIDTVSMQHLCRVPAVKIKKSRNTPKLGLTFIEEALKKKRLTIYLDNQGSLKDEWGRTCGHEIITQLLIKWGDIKEGLVPCQTERAIKPPALNKTLKDCDFNDAGDKLIIRIGQAAINPCGAPEFFIATSDGDFWDPKDDKKRGAKSAPVARALRDHKLHSTLLKDFLALL